MRQVLLKDSGALVARMPCPAVEPGTVLVRVHYSLISVGTEIASLRPVWAAFAGATPGERMLSCFSLAEKYLGKAIRNPGKAWKKAVQLGRQMACSAIRRLVPTPSRLVAGVATTTADPGRDSKPRPSDLHDQGCSVGYSAAGEVVAVGAGITDLVPGDWVACAGAGQANHADFICVRRTLFVVSRAAAAYRPRPRQQLAASPCRVSAVPRPSWGKRLRYWVWA